MGEIIVVTSLKGGVGKTTFSAGLAFALAKMHKKVLAVDMDLGTGGLDIALGNEDFVASTFFDILSGKASFSEAMISDDNGISFLSAPVFFDENDEVDIVRENFDNLLKMFKENFDFVIFDMPAGGGKLFRYFEESGLCDRCFIVSTSAPTSVRAAERCAMRLSGFGSIKLIINSFRLSSPKDNSFGILEIVERISVPIIGVIPFDAFAEKALLKGMPLSAFDSSLAGKAIKNISERICGHSVFLLNGIMKLKNRQKFY